MYVVRPTHAAASRTARRHAAISRARASAHCRDSAVLRPLRWTIQLDSRGSLYYICDTVFRKPNPSSGVPIYVQLKEQIRHAVETGALPGGHQLPGIRGLAESLVINPNTVVKAYRELENEGLLEIRHGLGAFITTRRSKSKSKEMREAQQIVREIVERLKEEGLDAGEIVPLRNRTGSGIPKEVAVDAVIETTELSKNYGKHEAVKRLSIAVQGGSVCAFLGQNGAGKSSTIKMLLGMTHPMLGTGTVFGHRIENERESLLIREQAAFVAEDKRLYEYMTVAEILRFTRSFFPRVG